MDLIEILRAVFGLAFVLGLIALCAFVARRSPGLALGAKPRGRLTIAERLILDPRRQIIIVQEGAREHVILLGATSECLIESRETPKAPLRLVEPGQSS
jgi:flagellar protein FliO/FliZ